MVTNKKTTTKKVVKEIVSKKPEETTQKVIKDKSLAIFLAITSGPLAWIYTYKEDNVKFWIVFISIILLFWTIIVPIAAYVYVIVDMCIKKSSQSNYKWVY
jgi:magnesium-transporting ATPase (P-type)